MDNTIENIVTDGSSENGEGIYEQEIFEEDPESGDLVRVCGIGGCNFKTRHMGHMKVRDLVSCEATSSKGAFEIQ